MRPLIETVAGETELVERRSRKAKTFRAGNQFRFCASVGPVHYRDDPFSETEAWKEIDVTIEPTDGPIGEYAVTRNGYRARFWTERAGYVCAARFERAGSSLEMAPEALSWVNDAGEVQGIALPNPAARPVIDNEAHTITWRDAFGPGIDYGYRVWPDHLFKVITIRSRAALPRPTIGRTGLRLRVWMRVRWTGATKADAPLTADAVAVTGRMAFKDALGRRIWNLCPALAWHAGNARTRVRPQLTARRVADGEAIVAIDTRVDEMEAAGIVFPLHIDASISETVPSSADDGYMNLTGYSWSLDEVNDVMGYIEGPGISCDSWFRFTTVDIPAGSTVSASYVRMTAYENSSEESCTVRTYGQLEGNAHQIVDADDYSATTKTTGYNNVTLTAWGVNNTYEANTKNAAIEIVGQGSWATGQAMAFSIRNQASMYCRKAWDYFGSAAKAAQLSITYTPPAPPPSGFIPRVIII